MTQKLTAERTSARLILEILTIIALLTCLAYIASSRLSADPDVATPAGASKMKGTYLKFSVTPDDQTESAASQAQLCANIFKRKFAQAPYAVMITAGKDYIEVYVNTSNPEHLKEIKKQLTYRGKLSIHLVHRESTKLAGSVAAKEKKIPGYIILPHIETNSDTGETTTTPILIRKKAEINEKDVKTAYLNPRDQSIINVELNQAGGEKMQAFTKTLTKTVDMIATVYNGRILNYATIVADSLSRNFVITGLESVEESELLIGAVQSLINSTLEITEQRGYKTILLPR